MTTCCISARRPPAQRCLLLSNQWAIPGAAWEDNPIQGYSVGGSQFGSRPAGLDHPAVQGDSKLGEFLEARFSQSF
jgi:hypothetical protein